MGSHSVTCHPTQVNVPGLTPTRQGGTRFTYPRGMEGWVDLGSLIAAWPGIESTTTWSQVQRPNRYATESHSELPARNRFMFAMEHQTVVPFKITHLQKCCKNVLEFILHITTSKIVVKMFYAENVCTKVAKMLQNIFCKRFSTLNACWRQEMGTCKIKHLQMVMCKMKHFYNILCPRHSHGKSAALKHFCKCFANVLFYT